MSYQTAIPDGFKPPQFRDEKFEAALKTYRDAGHRAAGPNIIAIPRPDLDPSSRQHYELGAGIEYVIDAKTDQVAMMHVLSAGPGRVRTGFREHVPVSTGDMVLLNLREAGHWVYIEGILCYTFTSDVCMARVYRTDKPLEPPAYIVTEDGAHLRARREWQDALFWNIRDVLNDYVVLGQDPNAEREYRSGAGTRVLLPETAHADGTTSDHGRRKHFPLVYRRVLGAGPGRTYVREVEGLPDYVHSIPECEPGDMLVYSKAVRAASFTFQSMPLEIIHAASVLDIKSPPGKLVMHESVPQEIPFDAPSEVDRDEDDQLRGRTG